MRGFRFNIKGFNEIIISQIGRRCHWSLGVLYNNRFFRLSIVTTVHSENKLFFVNIVSFNGSSFKLSTHEDAIAVFIYLTVWLVRNLGTNLQTVILPFGAFHS